MTQLLPSEIIDTTALLRLIDAGWSITFTYDTQDERYTVIAELPDRMRISGKGIGRTIEEVIARSFTDACDQIRTHGEAAS